MGCNNEKIYNDSSYPETHNLSWMKNIPDHTRISEMTIPGTHNSCALYGICCARTQTWTLLEQMKAGIRFFDIRLRLYNNTLRAFHGFVDQIDTFDVILLYAIQFLNQNPSETIIMQIITEYTPKNCTKKMPELYEEYTLNYKNNIYEYDFNNEDITLGDIRGKIFIIKIFNRSTRRVPNFFIQNEWTINCRLCINKKKRRIKENFHRAIVSKNNKNIFLNYLSASSDYGMMTPYTAAKKCNKIAMKFHGRLGIVLADYPGENLIKHLIDQNFINPEEKEVIKNGDLVYFIHNDTYKYLYLDKNPEDNNNIYCVKEPEPLIIRHKDTQIGRDTFKVNDFIVLIGRDGYQYEFQIGKTFSGNEEIIDEKSIIMIQVLKNGKMKYLENCYENKNKKKHYLFNFSNSPGSYESYFFIQKAKPLNVNTS